MPEMRFVIRWPDGRRESCYSPSLVIKDFLREGESYPVPDFLKRSRQALRIASGHGVEHQHVAALAPGLGLECIEQSLSDPAPPGPPVHEHLRDVGAMRLVLGQRQDELHRADHARGVLGQARFESGTELFGQGSQLIV